MRVFLTGATGYIGSVLGRRLVEAGHDVCALVRATSRPEARRELEGEGARLFEGDVTDRYSMREGMSGADWVVHAAAELDFTAEPGKIERTNVTGSENVASLAWKLGVGRVLAVSSIAALGSSPEDGTVATEETSIELPFASAYGATKHAGERAFAAWAERGLKVNVVHPSLVYGPPGSRGGMNPVLRAVVRRRLPAIVGGRKQARWIFLADLVDGICRMLERAEPGVNYLMTGDRAPVAEVLLETARLAGVEPPRRRMSVRRARLVGLVVNPIYEWRGKRPPINVSQLESLDRSWDFDDAKARSELDWTPRSLAQGLPETVRYLEDEDRS